jgi:cholesterol transport system auxiliary component
MKSKSKVIGILLLALSASGCALTSKGEALSVRWFSPETVRPRITSAETAKDAGESARPTLELGRITSGLHLRDKIAYRDAAFEVGYYDDRRWTERPEVFVRRSLARTLFEERGIRRALAGGAPVLDVEVIAFEEIRGPSPAARIQLRVLVHDDRHALVEKTITVDRPIAGRPGIDGLVQAMAEALDAAADDVAAVTESAVRAAPSAAAASVSGSGPTRP